jgi:nucleoside-diphosphate-sugar epimerase
MKIAVLGSGFAGRTLAGGLAGLGHDITIGTRDVKATLDNSECPVQSNLANSRLTLRMILRSPEFLCESLPGFARSEANTVDL